MNKVLNKSWFDFDNKVEVKSSIIIGLLAFLIPLFLGKTISLIFGSESILASNAQIIIGTIVNSLLIVCALNLKGWKKIIGVITMPSIATICSGFLFQSASNAMIWMIPGIWLGNFAFVYIFKLLMVQKNYNYFLTGIVAIIIKVLIIFGAFNLLNAFNIFPNAMIDTLKYMMGIAQGLTGLFGLLLGYLIYTSYRY